MHFKYLLWDFDGTLFDTYPPLIQAVERALAELGTEEARDVIAERLSDTLAACIADLAQAHQLDPALFEARIDYYWRKTTPKDSPPFPGVIHACQRLLAAGGSNYIVTHRGRESLMALLGWYKVAGLFADMLTRDDGYPRKPDPAAFNALLDRHQLRRDQTLVIGDRKLDILAGRAAGMHTCLFNASPTPDAPPDYVISCFDELPAILGLNL
jgi:HAD superfamily hydrolase (TIGR01509 family)